MFKDFNITERWKFQFRSEAFNLFNTPVFNTPGMNVTDSKALGGNGNFGKITSTRGGHGAALAVRSPAVVLRLGVDMWPRAPGRHYRSAAGCQPASPERGHLACGFFGCDQFGVELAFSAGGLGFASRS